MDHVAARQARERAGLTQVELARLAGISPVTLLRMEQPGNLFTMRVLRQVALALDEAQQSPSLAVLLGR